MFEASLIDIQTSQSRRTPAVLATAAGLHFAIFAAALSAAYWHIGPVAEPRENAVFIMQAALPSPPPSGGTRVRTETAPPKPVAPAQEAVQPKAEEIAEDIAKAAEVESPSAPADVFMASLSDSGPATSGGPGIGDGPISGFDGPSTGSEFFGPGVVSDQPYKLTGAIVRPVLLSRVEPVYPESARRARLGGTVILETVIDESGRVTNVKVVKGLGFGLQQAAIDAVSRWHFKPATMNGRAVKVFFNLTVQFSLN